MEVKNAEKSMVERTGGASTIPCSVLPVLLLSCNPGGNGSCCSAQSARKVSRGYACSRLGAVLPFFASALGTDDDAVFALPQGATHF